jgi:hypothetical protein
VVFNRWGPEGVAAKDSVIQYRMNTLAGTQDLWSSAIYISGDNETDTIDAQLLLPQGVTRIDSLFLECEMSSNTTTTMMITEVQLWSRAIGTRNDTMIWNSTTDFAGDSLFLAKWSVNNAAATARNKVFLRIIGQGDVGHFLICNVAFLRCSRIDI